MRSQPIRLSQFVVVYGPGAILEGPKGPRMIPMPDIGLFHAGNGGLSPAGFEVSDQRMSHGLLGGARIFRLPSNAERGVGDGWYLYRTRPFPSWSLCLNSAGHGGRYAALYQAAACPLCGQAGQRRQHAIRFVRACAEGHLDDVDWVRVVHRPGSACTQNRVFRWHGIGGALSQIQLECPACGDREVLGVAYGREWPCSGRYPEREQLGEPPHRMRCPEAARIVQRQASNLRLPELRTLFTIPPRSTHLHNLLQSMAVRVLLTMLNEVGPITEPGLRRQLEVLAQRGMIPKRTADEIMANPWPEVTRAVDDVLAPVRTDFAELILEEFHALIEASVHGAPPVRGPAPTSRVVFEVNRADVGRVTGPRGRTLRITPVARLRTVAAQIGYRREVPRRGRAGVVPATVVRVPITDQANQEWYPGVEYFGEGLFITLDHESWHFELGGDAASHWTATRDGMARDSYGTRLFRAVSPDELNPVFVWWHTFSHLLLRSVSIDAGYSASAIRERVFVEADAQGRSRGGVILYATQPGSDGTMGGLIALVPHFQRIVDRAVDMATTCSNDPLCLEQHFAPGAHNGPACYSCMLVSETSCENRNLWLDRELLLDNLP